MQQPRQCGATATRQGLRLEHKVGRVSEGCLGTQEPVLRPVLDAVAADQTITAAVTAVTAAAEWT